MEYLRKEAAKRFKELKSQKVGNTTIITPKPFSSKDNTLKPRRRTDEVYSDMVDRFWQDVEDKMIDLSRWNGEGNLYEYRGYEDAENYYN